MKKVCPKYHDRPYKGPARSEEIGEIGEQEACAKLQLVLRGHVSRLQGQSDKGLDLAFTGYLPCPERPLLHFVGQVKTGQSKIKKLSNSARFRLQSKEIKRLLQWRTLESPVMFLWVDNLNNKIYWRLISKDGKGKYIYLSRQDVLSPLTPFDLVIKLNRTRETTEKKVKLEYLCPSANENLKEYAKKYYEEKLLGKCVHNPIIGDVAFSWRGWRHLVSNRRTLEQTRKSLQLLPAVKKVLADPNGIIGFRRLENPYAIRGCWTTQSRLIIFERNNVDISGKSPVDIVVVVRERIIYLTNWQHNFDFDCKMIRDLHFESVYENIKLKSCPILADPPE